MLRSVEMDLANADTFTQALHSKSSAPALLCANQSRSVCLDSSYTWLVPNLQTLSSTTLTRLCVNVALDSLVCMLSFAVQLALS